MVLHPHLPHPHLMAALAPVEERFSLGSRVFAVQRAGAVLVGLFLLAFGLIGFAGDLSFTSTRGTQVLGMSTDGLLSAISVVVALVLLAAAARGPRVASTTMVVLGVLFLISALVNLGVLETNFNLLAFEFSNVVFSIVVGLLLLVLGAYGRFNGHLPPDSPYAHPSLDLEDDDGGLPATPAEFAAERAMRAAEIAVVQHTATPEQDRLVRAMAQARTRAERRRVWMELDRR